MKQIMILVAMMTLVTIDVAAVEFGSIPFDQDKLVDGREASYRVGLINPMNETVTVQLETEGTGPLEIVSDQAIDLKPSRTATSPSGSGWMVYDDGYIKPTRTTLTVRLPRTASEQEHTFSVTPTIQGEVPSTAGSSVAFATQHKFVFETTLPLGDDEDDTGGWPIFGSGDDEQEKPRDTPEDREAEDNPEDSSSRETDEEQSPITKTTILLLASIIIVSTYIWRQIR